jgi:hypothetical protein
VKITAGNRKLSKKRSSGIDGAIALAVAIGVAPAAWTAKVDIAALIGWAPSCPLPN